MAELLIRMVDYWCMRLRMDVLRSLITDVHSSILYSSLVYVYMLIFATFIN